MCIPLGLLSLASIFSGYLTKDLFMGLGSNFFIDSIFINNNKITPLLISELFLFDDIVTYNFHYK